MIIFTKWKTHCKSKKLSPNRVRTDDLAINSRTLYQLSYGKKTDNCTINIRYASPLYLNRTGDKWNYSPLLYQLS